MLNRTMPRADERAEIVAPFPAQIIGRAPDCHSADVYEFKFSFLHDTGFVR